MSNDDVASDTANPRIRSIQAVRRAFDESDHPDLSRSELEDSTGLSGRATRNALAWLVSEGEVSEAREVAGAQLYEADGLRRV